ncbi:MAG: hypothetical protein Q4A78_00335 [Peptostreptococcaceae bacterium]|nr:hypothetical protein [Peptostreptococcaceae bacterium]
MRGSDERVRKEEGLIFGLLEEEVGGKRLSGIQREHLIRAMRQEKKARTLGSRIADFLEYEVEWDLGKIFRKKSKDRVITMRSIGAAVCILLILISFPYPLLYTKEDRIVTVKGAQMICRGGR